MRSPAIVPLNAAKLARIFRRRRQTVGGLDAGSGCFRGRGWAFTLSRRRGYRVVPLMKRPGPDVALVDRNVEAGLAKLLLHIDLAFSLKTVQTVAHPVDFASAQTALGDIDRGACEVRTGDVTHSRRGVAIGPHQMLLILDGAYSGTDFKRVMKLGLVRTRKVGEKSRSPRTAVASIQRQVGVD